MREFTKSMMSYTWAMSVFGAQQMFNLLTPGQGDPAGKVADALNNVTDATAATFERPVKDVFEIGDRLQKGVVDIMFGGFMSAGMDPNQWVKMGADAMGRMTDIGMQAGRAAGAGFSGAAAATGVPGSNTQGGGAGPSQSGSPNPPSGAGWGPMPAR